MAVHVLAVLAYKEGDPVTSSLLAGSVNTNPVIIRRLLLSLKRARLIDTRKGAGAGSRLSRSPQRINLAEIYRAVESHEAFSSPAEEAECGLPGGKLHSQDAGEGVCIGGKRHGAGLGKDDVWRMWCRRRGKHAWARRKEPFDVLFFCAKM